MGRKAKSQMNVMTVTKVGQVTIPKFLREKYNIVDTVRMVERPEGILIQKDEELDSILERIHSRFTPEMKRWIKKNKGITADELREKTGKTEEGRRALHEWYD